MKRIAAICLLCIAPLHVAALTPEDFAFGYPLASDEQTSIYRLDLPAGVYGDAVRADLGDLRVFNGAREVVPHSLRRPALKQDAESAPQAVPFYPLETQLPDGKNHVAIQLRSDAQGTIINVDGDAPLQGGRVVSAYLLDCTALPQSPNRLELTWSDGSDSKVMPVDVSSSDDLTQWSPLAGATLLRLTYAGHRLERRSIELPSRHYKYLRLSWPGDAQNAALTGVQARFPRSDTRRLDQWLEIAGLRGQETKPVYEYDTQALLPVERVDLALAQNNSLLEGVLSSRAATTAPWTQRYRGVFYRLREQGTELRNETVSLSMISDRYWRLEVTSDPAGLGDRPPLLRLGWVPHELFYLARGAGPYLLTFGSSAVLAQSGAVDVLLSRIDTANQDGLIGTARPAARVTLGGPDKLQPLAPPFPWQRFILWGVLVLGVTLLGGMAWRLYGQMSGK